MMRLRSSAIAAFAATVGFGISAMAQQASGTAAVGVQGSATADTQTGATAQADPNAAAATPAPAQNQQMGMGLATATAAPPPGGSDHDSVVGHVGVGFLGRASLPVGLPPPGNPELPVPVIGVRYWMDPMLGLDLGLGLYLGGQSNDATTTPPGGTASASGPSPTAFVLHAGVPLALMSSKHFAFEIIPEANFGYAKVSWDAGVAPGGVTKQTGVHLDLGARAGGEIHFGFMGIPQLSLVGSVGLRFDYDKLGQDTTAAGGAVTNQSTGVWALRTTVYDSPWNIFISNVSAFYYF